MVSSKRISSLDNDCDVSNLCNYSHNTDSDIAPTTNLELLAWNKEVIFYFVISFLLYAKLYTSAYMSCQVSKQIYASIIPCAQIHTFTHILHIYA